MTNTARTAQRNRDTKETTIAVALDVDGTGRTEVSTGLPFFDHMVEQLGKHASFDLTVDAKGDLHIDAHHTVETSARPVPSTSRTTAIVVSLVARSRRALRGALVTGSPSTLGGTGCSPPGSRS